MHELAAGTTERVSMLRADGITAGPSYQPSLSGDGRYVAFASQADLVEGDTNLTADVFVRDRMLGTLTRVSLASDGDQGDLGSTGSEDPAISADGRHVAFTSDARDLAPGVDNTNAQIYVRDRTAGATALVSVSNAGAEGAGDHSLAPTISADGHLVAFHSGANNLYPGHVFDTIDIVLRDTVAGVTTPITVGRSSGDYSIFPSLSADGGSLVFASLAAFLVDGDTNGAIDVFQRAVTGADETPPALSSRVRSASPPRHPPARRSNTAPPQPMRPTRIPPSPASLRRESRSRSATRPSPAPRPTRAAIRPPGRSPSTSRGRASRSTISNTCSSSSPTSRAGCGRAWTPCSCSPKRWSPRRTSEALAPT